MVKTVPQYARQVSDVAIQAKTGKSYQQWFAILDAAGAMQMNHTQMAEYLSDQYGSELGWHFQMIVVAYEQERGLREKHQKPGGYEVSISKTLAGPLATLYHAWIDDTTRTCWLKEPKLTIRKATPNKSLRITWIDGNTILSVNFYAKGESKSQVTVQHIKLANAREADQMKSYWKEALERLEASV